MTSRRALPYGIMFHHFHSPDQHSAQGSITAEDFASALEFAGRKNILPAHEWYQRAVEGKLEKNNLCLTFDDNLMCQYEVAVPVLEHYGLTGFFFIYSSVCQGNIENLEVYRRFRTGYFDSIQAFYEAFERDVQIALPELQVGKRMDGFNPDKYLVQYSFYTPQDRRFRYIRDEILKPSHYFQVMDAMIALRGLTKEQLAEGLWMNDHCLRSLSDKGHIVGLHSYSHPTRLCELTPQSQASEFKKNYEHIVHATGRKPQAMSHPCNSYSNDTLNILHNLGIKIGFCSNMGEVKNRGSLEFPRLDHADLVREMQA